MKKAHYIFFGSLIALIVFLQYDLSNRLDRVTTARMVRPIPKNTNAGAPEPVLAGTTEIVTPTPRVRTVPFLKRFQMEAAHVGKVQANPELAKERMRILAREMTAKDVEQMYEIMSDERANGDQRALAVELLSIKNDGASLQALQNFVANSKSISGAKWDSKKELETVLRAQAVESIANFPEKDIAISTLNFLQQKVDQKFLSERIGRASLNLMSGGNKPVQQQDEEALKKLVE